MTVTDIKLSPVNDIAEKALKELGVNKRDTNGNTQFGTSSGLIHPLALSYYPWLIVSVNLGKTEESYYTIIAIDFASRYWVSRGNSANTLPNLNMDTRLVVISV